MKIAQIMVDGFEDIEAITTIDLLRRANIKIDTISLENKEYLTSAHNIIIKSDFLLKNINLEDYDGYILPGGPGYAKYEQSEILIDMLKQANNNKKMIAAICAAPSFLAKIGLLDNHKATVFPEMAEDLDSDKITYLENRVVISKNIITGPAVGNALNFALSIIEYLKDKETSEKIKNSIYY